jgi:LAO/AO transport system kinase
VLEALGLEIIFVETVGAGQSDVDIARFADTVLVVLMPGAGDEVQFLKAGLLEAADILVVNKSDLPGAGRTAASLRELAADRAGWIVPVLETAALDGRGVDALWRQCLRHRAHREE